MAFSPVLLFLQFCVRKCIVLVVFGEVSERLNEPVSKTGVLFIEYRGFESRPLRFLRFQSGAFDLVLLKNGSNAYWVRAI